MIQAASVAILDETLIMGPDYGFLPNASEVLRLKKKQKIPEIPAMK